MANDRQDNFDKARADKVFGRLFVDTVCGQTSIASIGGKRYMLLTYDDFSRFTWTYFMRQKPDTVALLLNSFGRRTRGRNPLSSRSDTFG